ncbi:MAG: aspartyl protease family protein [Verrucomicrobiota bacterium]|jgi:hypothetical protein
MTARSIITFVALLSLGLAATGCVSSRKPVFDLEGKSVTIPFEVSGTFLRFAGHPTVKAMINGVTGRFIIDTGAPGPILTTTAVRRCGIVTFPSRSRGADMFGAVYPLSLATNITIRFTPQFSIHYKEVLVSPEHGDNFGLLDFGTLRSAHAVMDMGQKTITVTK